jgi:uncharacterized membrane protein required for colicin V production
MGLDVALGAMILMAAVRGWLQGFIRQAVRLTALVACVYLAQPVRDYAKPYIIPALTTVPASVIDRLLWWASAVAVYIVSVGIADVIIKMSRRPEVPGIRESDRNDQFAGFLLGAVKGAITVAFVTAGVHQYAISKLAAIPWAEQQVRGSWALKLDEKYHPSIKIWESVPVRHFIARVQSMGMREPGQSSSESADEPVTERPPLQTAARTPKLQVPAADRGRDEAAHGTPESRVSQPDPVIEAIKKVLE